jgi:phosphonate transport system permease protein
MNAKKWIFDAFALTCTLALTLYAIFPITQETYVESFSTIMLAAGGIFVIALAIARAVHAFRLQRLWTAHLLILFVLAFWVSIRVTETSLLDLLDREGLTGAWRLWSGLAHPNLILIPKALAQAAQTILIAFLASVLAIPVAFVLAFFAAQNLMHSPWLRPLYVFTRLFLNITRSVEPLIWALIFTVWVGVGPFAGMLALMVHSIASLTKYYSEIIENVNEGPLDAIRSTGANPMQVAAYAIVPQVLLPYVAMTVFLWDTNVRMATVIGLVGGGGIGTLLIQYQGQGQWPEVGAIILVIAVIVWLLDAASAYIRAELK